MRGFLYGQTEYNLLCNACRLEDYISLAKKNNFDYLTITDSNLYGSYKFYKKCKQNNIKPIIGLEYSYNIDGVLSKAILYALNNTGYQELLKINKEVSKNKDASLELIKNNSSNLAVIFIFKESYLYTLLFSKESQSFNELLSEIKSFKHSYIGISETNNITIASLNAEIEEIAINKGIKCIPVCQCCYLDNEDKNVYLALKQMGGKSTRANDYFDLSFQNDPPQNNIIDDLINSINLDLFNEKPALPKYPNTKGHSSKDYLYALCKKGLEKRNALSGIYEQRLNYELYIINKMGFDDYFLIVWDYIKFAKNNKILVGPGRGSAAGSLVAYCLGITEVDPIKFNLLFERFLNPERITMPDIDTDFPDDKRELVINHIRELYGDDHVCNITAFGTFQMKAAIRELARVRGIERFDTSLIDAIERLGIDRVIENYSDDEEKLEFINTALKLVDIPKHISTHAAGIIISERPLSEFVPIQITDGLAQSQLEACDLEELGLLKMDFLSISNLKIIQNIIDLIPGFDSKALREIPLNDKATINLFQRADTLGIFQFESRGMRDVLLKLHPESFEDIVAVLALYRPGPMDSINDFIEHKKSGKISCIHNDLIPILKNTYGIIVYQEQIMQIAQVFAGYSLGEADILRRAVSKKHEDELLKQRSDFVARSIKKGYPEKVAIDIYDLILKFANYGFNRSHTVAYAIFSYQMAYLKCHYFNAFMAKIMDHSLGAQQVLGEYISYARRGGLAIKHPDINISTNVFEIRNNEVYLPFTAVKGIGDSIALQIVKEREKGEFKDFDSFKERCSFISNNLIKGLIMTDSFMSFRKTKKSLLKASNEDDLDFSIRFSDELIVDNSELSFKEMQESEKEYLGFNLVYNILDYYDTYAPKYRPLYLNSLRVGAKAGILGVLTNTRIITTKKGDMMLVGTVEDVSKAIHFVMFPSDYSKLKLVINEQTLYFITGILSKDNKNELSFTIQSIIPA